MLKRAAVALAAALAMLLALAGPAMAAPSDTSGQANTPAPAATSVTPQQHQHTLEAMVVAVGQAAQQTAGAITTARRGEGVIRITMRICGNARNWPNVAASNNIRPPRYLVLLGQRMAVSCSPGTTVRPGPSIAPTSGWVAPVQACVVSGFGWRGTRMHWGVDLAAGYGQPIRAAAAGTLTVGYQAGGAGNYSMIVHGGGLATVYMHQSRFAIRSGHVNAGQIIGYVGATGNASGPHLHFETHTAGLWNGRVNPVSFMSARGVRLGC